MDKVDRDTWTTSPGWIFIAHGIYETCDADQPYKIGASLGECIEHCQKYRESNGRDWNGLIFNIVGGTCGCQKNSREIHTEGRSGWVLHRVA